MNARTEARARMHAALGDPVRLAIVDRLWLGDESPSTLAADFELPTNLLAHHLRALEDAGIVRRVRSEGDRRRSYVQLRFDDPIVVTLAATSDPHWTADRVVFVCTQNSARSQLAAAAWRTVSRVPAASAGTRPAERVHARAVAAGARHGLRLGRARTARIEEVVRAGDLVVAVCDNAHEELPAGGRLHWAMPDPVRVDTDEAFETTYAEISQRVSLLATAVTTGSD